MSTSAVMHAEKALREPITNLRDDPEASDWSGIPKVLERLADYFDEIVRRGLFEWSSEVQPLHAETEDVSSGHYHTWSFGDSLKVVLVGQRFHFAPPTPKYTIAQFIGYHEMTFLQDNVHTDVKHALEGLPLTLQDA